MPSNKGYIWRGVYFYGHQKKTDENIQNKLGRSNILTKIISWITGTVAGPIVSFASGQ